MKANKQTRLTLFTTRVDFIGYDVYERPDRQHAARLNAHTLGLPGAASSAPRPLGARVCFLFGLLEHMSAYANRLKGL